LARRPDPGCVLSLQSLTQNLAGCGKFKTSKQDQ
jgi:hypothetical protein